MQNQFSSLWLASAICLSFLSACSSSSKKTEKAQGASIKNIPHVMPVNAPSPDSGIRNLDLFPPKPTIIRAPTVYRTSFKGSRPQQIKTFRL